jgi:hypothetical protein
VLPLDALKEALWPSESLVPHAVANRLYVAMSTLRALGLADLLQNHGNGWRLDPATPLHWERGDPA